MNIREYQNLVLYCEALLAKVVNKPECLAFSSLHIRNPHPSQTARFFPETKATLKNNCRKKILRQITKCWGFLYNIFDRHQRMTSK